MSTDARDIITQLLHKDPTKRLGSGDRSLQAVRKHAFFKTVNWAALADHRLEAPIQPFRNRVNASDVHEIDRHDERDIKHVTVTAQEQDKYYGHFTHTMSHEWQREILASMYDMMVSAADKADAKWHKKMAQCDHDSTSRVPRFLCWPCQCELSLS